MALVGAQIKAVVSVEGADKAKNDLQETGKSAEQTKQSFGEMMKQGLANAASFAVFNVGAKALGFLKDQFTDTLQVAIQHQDVLAQTAQVIKSTGGAAGLSANQISDLASSLSKVTTFSQDATEQGENLLLTFTGIGKDVFPLATKTMLDMSQAMGQDVKSSAIQLGKALNDPAQGLTALTRVGVTFTDKQKEMIQKMVAVGDTAGAQKIMLAELQREFGGSAEAAGKTFGGQLKILQNNLDDVKIKIGTALMPVLSSLVSNISQYVVPWISKFGDYLSSPAFQSFASGVGKAIMDTFNGIGNILKSVDWGTFIDDFKTLASDLAPIVTGLIPPKSTVFNTVGDVIKNVVKDVGDFAKHLGDAIKFISTHQDALDAFKAVLIATGIVITTNLVAAFAMWAAAMLPVMIETLATAAPYLLVGAIIAAVVFGIIELIQHWGGIVHWLQGVWAGFSSWFMSAMGAIGAFFTNIWNGIASFFKGIWDSIVGSAKSSGNAISSWWKGLWDGIVNGAKAAWNFIVNAVRIGAQTLLAVILGPFILIGQAFIWLYNHNHYFKALVDAIVGFFVGCFNWLHGAWDATVAWLVGLWQRIATIATTVWGAITGAITFAVQAVWTWLVSAWTVVSAWLVGVWNGLVGFASALWNQVAGAIRTGFSAAIGFVSWVWGVISSFFVNAWTNYIVSPLTAMWQNVSNAFSSAWSTYVSKPLSDLWTSISKWFSDLGEGASKSASNFIKMLADGITSGAGKIWDAVKGIANTIWKALGFHSPAEEGPASDADKWMPNLVNMFHHDLMAGVPKIQEAVFALAKPIQMTMSPNNTLPSGITALPASVARSSSQGSRQVIENHLHVFLDGKDITDSIMTRTVRGTRTSGPIRSNVS